MGPYVFRSAESSGVVVFQLILHTSSVRCFEMFHKTFFALESICSAWVVCHLDRNGYQYEVAASGVPASHESP